jgi:methane/ammonia monooxygenase subunit A
MGFEYIRTAMPEYVRIIEQSTLRTFGDAVTPLTAVFAGFLNIMNLWFWAWIGSLGVRATWLRKVV